MQRSAPSSTDGTEEGLLYMNLCLLGLPQFAAKSAGVELSRQCFRKPNPKALEAVLYGLHSAIHGEQRTAKEFKNIWPITDKSQSKDFNQKVNDWFKELREKHQLESIGSMTVSQLRSATGHRVISTLLELSSLALLLHYQRCKPEASKGWQLQLPIEKDPRLFADLAHALPSLAAVGATQQCQQFVSLTQKAAEHQAQVESLAQELSEEFYQQRAQRQRLQYELSPQEVELMQKLEQEGQGALPGTLSSTSPLLPADMELGSAAQRVAADLASLEAQLAGYAQLAPLMEATAGAWRHPHAVDGRQLSQLAAQRGGTDAPGQPHNSGRGLLSSDSSHPAGATEAAPVDIAQLLESWVGGLESSVQPIMALSHYGGTTGLAPLVALPSEPSSHAALLQTQLRQHEGALQDLKVMRDQLTKHLESAESMLTAAAAAVTSSHGHTSSPLPRLLDSRSSIPSSDSSLTSAMPLVLGVQQLQSSSRLKAAGQPIQGPQPASQSTPPSTAQGQQGGRGQSLLQSLTKLSLDLEREDRQSSQSAPAPASPFGMLSPFPGISMANQPGKQMQTAAGQPSHDQGLASAWRQLDDLEFEDDLLNENLLDQESSFQLVT